MPHEGTPVFNSLTGNRKARLRSLTVLMKVLLYSGYNTILNAKVSS